MRVIVFACIAACAAPRPQSPATAPDDASAIVIELFGRYDVVGLPEFHRNKEMHEFLRGLVADLRIGERGVTNIVVEFGNARLQVVADRYVRGEGVPVEQVRAIWRETGQLMVWDSPVYEQFFRTVRDDRRLRPGQRRAWCVGGPRARAARQAAGGGQRLHDRAAHRCPHRPDAGRPVRRRRGREDQRTRARPDRPHG
jgi:hypothetical protein